MSFMRITVPRARSASYFADLRAMNCAAVSVVSPIAGIMAVQRLWRSESLRHPWHGLGASHAVATRMAPLGRGAVGRPTCSATQAASDLALRFRNGAALEGPAPAIE